MGDVAKDLRDVAYIAIGLGVLGFQKAQVRRRELAQRAQEMEQRVGPALKDLGERLEPVARQARQAAKDTAEQLQTRFSSVPGE